MKKAVYHLSFCWIIIGLIFFTIAILPMIAIKAPNSNIQEQNTPIRVFYSFLLCLPYLRAAQSYSNNPDFIRANKSSYLEYQKAGNVWAYYLDRFVYTLTIVVVYFLALNGIFKYLTGYHYLSIILYGTSILFVEIGISHD